MKFPKNDCTRSEQHLMLHNMGPNENYIVQSNICCAILKMWDQVKTTWFHSLSLMDRANKRVVEFQCVKIKTSFVVPVQNDERFSLCVSIYPGKRTGL
jgi:hypothetical protein